MWFELYLVTAAFVAITAWVVSPHFQSYDPPSDLTRTCWSLAAGALWPLVLVGAAQILAVRAVAKRLNPADSGEVEVVPSVALYEVSLRS